MAAIYGELPPCQEHQKLSSFSSPCTSRTKANPVSHACALCSICHQSQTHTLSKSLACPYPSARRPPHWDTRTVLTQYSKIAPVPSSCTPYIIWWHHHTRRGPSKDSGLILILSSPPHPQSAPMSSILSPGPYFILFHRSPPTELLHSIQPLHWSLACPSASIWHTESYPPWCQVI